jgi:hypothetical protein
MPKSSSSPPSYPKLALAYRNLAAFAAASITALAVLAAIGGVR